MTTIGWIVSIAAFVVAAVIFFSVFAIAKT